MRAFGRVYILLLPALFSPYLTHMALERSASWAGGYSEGARIAFACGISATVSVMLAGLYSVEQTLENPFSPSLDAVRVTHELRKAAQAIERVEAEAGRPDAWRQPLPSDDDDEEELKSSQVIVKP